VMAPRGAPHRLAMMTRATVIGGLLSTALAAGCGITVLVPGDGDDAGAGGQGAGAGPTTVTETTSTSSSGTSNGSPFPGCAVSCSLPSNGVDTCVCELDCNGVFADKASCAPIVDLQGNHKVQCTCTVSDEFTGVCYEKHPQELCSFDLGCCGKYLGK